MGKKKYQVKLRIRKLKKVLFVIVGETCPNDFRTQQLKRKLSS